MPRPLRSSLFALVTLALLAGCQQRPAASAPAVTTQLGQLSALIAGAAFLRDRCTRTDIPDDARLQQAARQAAGDRGWNTAASGYTQLGEQAQSRYQALLQDSTPQAEKCAGLNSVTAPFIRQLLTASE